MLFHRHTNQILHVYRLEVSSYGAEEVHCRLLLRQFNTVLGNLLWYLHSPVLIIPPPIYCMYGDSLQEISEDIQIYFPVTHLLN